MSVQQLDAARAGLARNDAIVVRLVRLSLLVRLVAVVAACGGLVGQELTGTVLVSVLLLVATSFAGLAQPRVLDLLVRHPLVAMIDLAVVVGVFVTLGVDSPLAIGALSTAFLTGVLFPFWPCLLLGATLLVGYAGAVARALDQGLELGFLLGVGMPVTYVCLLGIGQSFRSIQRSQAIAEGQLAELVQSAAAGDERARLAREVHDSLAKSLQGLAFGAASLPAWVERDGERARQEAAALASGASQAVQEARSLLVRMRTDEPHRPFDEVLTEVVVAWGRQHGHPVGTDVRPVTRLAADARYEVLAAVREVLENVRRHAPSARVEVRLRADESACRLVVQDDGPGFDPSHRDRQEAEGHFGLRGMEERMTSIDGTLAVATAPGAGVRVEMSVPLADRSLLAR